jgi:cell wall assembly regulator SMI1
VRDFVALKIRPAKRSYRPVRPSVWRILSWLPLDATQAGNEISASARGCQDFDPAGTANVIVT